MSTRSTLVIISLFSSLVMLSACGGGGGGGGLFNTPNNVNPAASAASILITSDKTSIKSDNLDTANIQVVVKDANNRPLKDVPVVLTSSLATGDLRVFSEKTDASGLIEATFRSGNNYANGLAVISAKIIDNPSLSSSVPIVITGSSLTSDIIEATLQTGERKTITYTATTGAGQPAGGVPICLDFNSTHLQVSGDLTSTTDCAYTIYTNVLDGKKSISVQALAQGNTTLRAQGLGITIETPFSIIQAGMSVIEPAAGMTHPNNEPLITRISVPGYTGKIRLATSAGKWSNNQSTVEVFVDNGVASENLLSGMPQGRIDITATKLDGSNSFISTYIYAYDPVTLNDSNTFIKLEITPTSLTARSNARAELKATVKKDLGGGNFVAAPPGTLVSFQISAGTGGGEYITLPTDDTDEAGIALSQLVSGSSASAANGVKVKACVVGTSRCEEKSLTIVDQPGSITIGEGTTVRSTADNTAYEYPLSVIVSDVNGGLLSGVPISLSVWPVEFATGCRDSEGKATNCTNPDLAYTFYRNEDLNMNVIRDIGELPTAGRTDCGSGSCALLPPNSAAGTLPSNVTTGSNGLATFNLTYLKEQASFLRVRITARASVQGSEIETSKVFILRPVEDDKKYLLDSPYNQYFR